MSRIQEVREKVNEIILKMDNQQKIPSAFAHLYGVSLSCTIIAKKRNEDVELAGIAGMLHDIYAYKSGSYKDHAHLGAELSQKILEELELFRKDEIEKVCHAIYYHDDKEIINEPFDEVLKDGDVMHHTLHDISKEIKEKEQIRYEKLMLEFDLK